MSFQNANGKMYDILDEHGDYTLLKEIKENYSDYDEPYVVAFDLNPERGEWAQGRYYQDLSSAQNTFKQKTS